MDDEQKSKYPKKESMWFLHFFYVR